LSMDFLSGARSPMRQLCSFALIIVGVSLGATVASGQTPAADPSARLREVLPGDVAERVLARIAEARARQLPAEALENRALKFAAKGVPALDIERSLAEQAERLGAARNALAAGRGAVPHGDEIEAGAEAMRKGVDGAEVSRLARTAPKGRSLAIPLFVIGSLTDRGLTSDQALASVLARLESNAPDAELERMPGELPPQAAGRGNAYGRDKARPDNAAKKPQAAGRPASTPKPATVPGNAGKKAKPAPANKAPRA
jgi:hypothetical protein